MSRTYSAHSEATAAQLWSLVSEPSRWPEWAPHVRGAWGLGKPEVQAGRRGAARLLWVLPIPAAITAKSDGRSWTWQVGPMQLDHMVKAEGAGSRLTMTLSAPQPLEAILAVTYGPIIAGLVDHAADVAARAR